MRKSDFNYQKLELEQVPCSVCGGREFETLAKVDRYRMGISTSGCAQCGLVMTNPRPSETAMDDFYQFHYRKFYESVEVPDQKYIRKIHKDIRAKYTVDFLEQTGTLKKTSRVLDFGCGEGCLLREISSRMPDLEVEAVEPGENFRDFAREYAACAVYASLDHLLESSSGKFDLITINHVLEHLMQPDTILSRLKQLLAEDGYIFIDVPAIEGYRSVESLHIGHMFHFSENTLQLLATSLGYRVLSIERHHPPNHPVSTRCLIVSDNSPVRTELGQDGNRYKCWSRIRDINRTAWKFYVMSSFIVKAGLFIPRRIIRMTNRGDE